MTTSRTTVSKVGQVSGSPRQPSYSIPFVLAGSVNDIAATSPPWSPRAAVTLTGVRAFLGDAGYNPTSPNGVRVQIALNNTPIDLLVAGAAATGFAFYSAGSTPNPNPMSLTVACHQGVVPGDIVTVVLWIPGPGATATRPSTNLTVILDFG